MSFQSLSPNFYRLWSHVLLLEETIEISDCYYSIRIKEILIMNSNNLTVWGSNCNTINALLLVMLILINTLYYLYFLNFSNNDSWNSGFYYSSCVLCWMQLDRCLNKKIIIKSCSQFSFLFLFSAFFPQKIELLGWILRFLQISHRVL